MKYNFCPICTTPLKKIEEEGFGRLVCNNSHCKFVYYNNPTPVVAAIVEHQGQIILARNPHWPPKWLGLITGFLEKNEDPEQAIIREVKEELSLEGEINDFVGLFSFKKRNQLLIVYHVKASGTIRLNEELESFKKFTIQKLRPWKFGTGIAVKVWLERQGVYNPPIDL